MVSHVWRRHILNHEQHGLSGYTEAPIRFEKSHIDHFRKQDLYQTLRFDWNNYVVDSLDENYGAKFKDNVVRTKADNERLVNPVVEDAQRFFKYELSGKMVPVDGLEEVEKQRADYTIDSFNLNEGSLMERRRMIINTVLDDFSDLSDEDVICALQSAGFPSVVEQLLKERTKNEEAVL